MNTNDPPTRSYTYGLDLIAQRLNTGTAGTPVWQTSYYGYDGQGSVRFLLSSATGSSTAITDEYDYDAYGQLLKTGTTPNNYRYTGEQWDDDLKMYYLRSRYMNPNTGRFWTMDSFEGNQEDPLSLSKYPYCNGNPVNRIDPSGHLETGVELSTAIGGAATVDSGGAVAVAVAKAFAIRRLQAAVAQSTINLLVLSIASGITIGGYELVKEHAIGQEFERIQTQTQARANPVGSVNAYVNFECDSFAADAIAHFKRLGKTPQLISFTAHENAIVSDAIYATFGWRSGREISQSGFHMGCLVDGRVYDNLLPFGVPRRVWEKYCYVVEPRNRQGNFISLRKAHNQKYGVIVPFPSKLAD